MGTKHKTTTRRGASEEVRADELARQERAYQLRLGCWTFQQIAESPHPTEQGRKLYAGASEARRGFLAARDRHAGSQETADIREEFRLRNEQIMRAILPRCLDRTDTVRQDFAIDRYTRLFAEHARMLGLFVDKVEVRQGESDLDAAMRKLREQMEIRAAGQPVPQE